MQKQFQIKTKNNQLNRYSWEALLIVLAFIVLGFRLNADFWNDEIYTLKHFTFVSIFTTLADYHVPNNHIFFNLVNNIYLKAISIDSLYELMERPWLIRLIPFIYALLTCYLTYKTAFVLAGRMAALFSTLILLTSIPFVNFAMQVRGYGLSMMLLILAVYASMMYSIKGRRQYLLLTGISTTALMYTLPSNFYVVLALFVFYSAATVWGAVTLLGGRQSLTWKVILAKTDFQLTVVIASGILIALLLYSFIFRDVFYNDYVVPGPGFDFQKLNYYWTEFYEAAFSERWVLIIPALLILLLGFKTKTKNFRYLILLALISTLPFFLVYVRGDNPPFRIFTVLMPCLAILPGVGVGIWFQILKGRSINPAPAALVLTLALMLVFGNKMRLIYQKSYDDIAHSIRSQDLVQQYYAFHFHPLTDVKALRNAVSRKELPIVILGGEAHGIPNYLDKEKLPYVTAGEMDSLLYVYDSLYVITNRPFTLMNDRLLKVEMVSPNISYNTVFQLSKTIDYFALQNEMDKWTARYGDSLGYVVQQGLAAAIKPGKNRKAVYNLENFDVEKPADLIDFAFQYPVIAFLSRDFDDVRNPYSIVTDGRNIVKERDSFRELAIFEKDLSKDNTAEGEDIVFNVDREFSEVSKVPLDNLDSLGLLVVSFDAMIPRSCKALLVFSLFKNQEHVIWEGKPLAAYYSERNTKSRVVCDFSDFDRAVPGDSLAIYVWNPGGESFSTGPIGTKWLKLN